MASTVGTDPLNNQESLYIQAATQYQQNYYEICSDWNRYEKDELGYLRDFIGYAFFGPPTPKAEDPKSKDSSSIVKNWIPWVFRSSESADENLNNKISLNPQDESGHYVYNDEKKDAAINLIYDRVIEYGSSEKSEGVILCSVIFNVIYNEKWSIEASKKATDESEAEDDKKKSCSEKEDENKSEKKETNEDENLFEVQVHPVPVLKVKRYERSVESKSNDANDTAEKVYYIDDGGRVYDGFNDYLENNKLPDCTMVFPKDGKYQIDPELCSHDIMMGANENDIVTKVWLDVCDSPMRSTSSKLLLGGDIASTVITVASMGVAVAAMVTPIGAGITLASTVGAGASGLWTVGRSAQQLADRNQHGESINVTNRTALGAWIGVAGGAMGLAATGGTVLLTRAVRTGSTVGRAATIAYDAVVIGNLIVNGVGIGYKSYDIVEAIMNGESPSAQDVFFLSAHIFFFYNSVVHTRLAQDFIENTQGQLLKDYEASLRSNRHRKEFQRLSRNTRASVGNDVAANEEIIRGINKIGNTDEFFQAMVRNRKAFSASNARASFSDGRVIVNSVLTIDPIEFSNLPKDVRVDIIKGVSTVQPNNTANVNRAAGGIPRNNETTYKNFTADSNRILKEFCVKHSSAMLQSAPPIINDFANVLADLRRVQNNGELFMMLLDIGYRILQAIPREDMRSSGDVLADIVDFIWQYVKINIRTMRPESCIDDPSLRKLIGQLVKALVIAVEEKTDIWVKSFKEWLRKEFP